MNERITSIQEVEAAIENARREIYRADSCVKTMARLIAGKLESSSVDVPTLIKLKRELQNFNIHTGRWKS